VTLTSLVALALATSALAQRPDVTDAERSLARGREALASGKFTEASAAFEEAAHDRPNDARAWSLLARARCAAAEERAAQGDSEVAAAEQVLAQAEEAARKAIELDATAVDGWAVLGHVLIRAGRSDEAIATLYHAEQVGPPSAELLLDLSDGLLAAREFALENDDAGAAAARLSEAEAALDRASGLADPQTRVLQRRAEVAAAKGDTKVALSLYRRAIHLRSNDTSLLEAHLALVSTTETFDDGIDFYTGLVDEPALSRWYRSRAHELRGNVELRRTKDYVAAANDYLAAEQDFRTCGKLDAELRPKVDAYIPSLRAYRGHALTLAEKFPEAEAALFSATDLDPAHAGALQFLHELQDAMWKKYGGESMPKEKWDEIRGFASKLATVEPGNAENWNNWGYFARECAKYEESYLAYRRSLALDPQNPRYLNDTALILMYHLNRDLDRAQQWLEQAIAICDEEMHDSGKTNSRRAEDEVTIGDAYGNLINLLQGTDRKEPAIARLRELESKFPKRSEVDYWKQKLLPEEWKAEQDKKAADEAAKKAADDAAKKGSQPAEAPKDGGSPAEPAAGKPPDGKGDRAPKSDAAENADGGRSGDGSED
jgi:tetratricopeptide (TPR) repeat protein